MDFKSKLIRDTIIFAEHGEYWGNDKTRGWWCKDAPSTRSATTLPPQP